MSPQRAIFHSNPSATPRVLSARRTSREQTPESSTSQYGAFPLAQAGQTARNSRKPRKSVRALAALVAVMLCMTAALLLGCNKTSSESSSSDQVQYQGTSVTLGNLSMILYDQEIVRNTSGKDCLALYLHVTNRGTSAESVMGSYNVTRNQGAGTHLKVAVAYDTDGNALHTGEKRIQPGESADIALCFVLVNDKPVTITFGNEERGVAETTLTLPLPEAEE